MIGLHEAARVPDGIIPLWGGALGSATSFAGGGGGGAGGPSAPPDVSAQSGHQAIPEADPVPFYLVMAHQCQLGTPSPDPYPDPRP